MIEIEQPLVKLLRHAATLYTADPTPKRGHPYTYSERTIFQCLVLKAVKRLHDCNGLYTYLAHTTNVHIRAMVGLGATLPHPRTFVRRFEASEPLMRRQVRAVADVLTAKHLTSFTILSIDGTLCNADGPVWHQSDRTIAHIPEKLRNLDLTADWGKSGYRGWTFGYKAFAVCTSGWNEPAIFVDGWVEKASVAETVSVRDHLRLTHLPEGNRIVLGDSGFDDKTLFDLCRELKSVLVTPVTAEGTSSLERCQKDVLFQDYVNNGTFRRRGVTIEPLFGYVKELFDLQVVHQHGPAKAGAEVVGAMAAYNLIIFYNVAENLTPRAVKAFLDAL